MKKLTLMLLVAMVPFLTMAQKRSKKNKKAKTEKVDNSNATYEFMVITGNQIMLPTPKVKSKEINSSSEKAKEKMRLNQKLRISFDFGGINCEENNSLSKTRNNSMSAAVNSAANYGWEFVSSNILRNPNGATYYYYMRRNK